MLNFLETGSSIDWSNPAVWLVIVVIILIIFFSVQLLAILPILLLQASSLYSGRRSRIISHSYFIFRPSFL